MKSDSHCLVPWRTIYVSPNGRVAPCCAFHSNEYLKEYSGTLRMHPGLQAIRDSFQAGQVPKGCIECFAREEVGLKSFRTEIIKNYQDLGVPIEPRTEFLMRHLDISFGNTCNLKCRFCKAENSSAWIKDRRELEQMNPAYWSSGHQIEMHDNTKILDSIFDYDLSQLMLLEIKGGEPFLYRHHLAFIKKLFEKVNLDQIRIHYVTNGTIFDAEVVEQLKRVKHLSITVSVDGTGAAYQYVRGGRMKLEKEIEENVKAFDRELTENMYLTFYFTLCAYNILEMNRLSEWVGGLNLKSRHRTQYVPLMDPPEVHVKVLPRSLRQEVEASLPRTEEFDDVRKILLMESEDQPRLLYSFARFTRELDKVRGQSLRDYIPQLAELLD